MFTYVNHGPRTDVYTDGSAIDNDTDDVKAGAGVYFGEGDPRNRSIRVPDEMWPSNQVGEILAIKEAVETAPLNVPLRIYSDSKYAIDGFTKNLQKWQDDGFYTVANGTLFELTVAKIRERTAPTEFVWVKGHSGVAGNEAADALAGKGSLKPDEDIINASARMDLILPGAKLKAMTQSKAYKIIRKLKMEKPTTQELLRRPATKVNMALAQAAVTVINGGPPPAKKIWRSTFDKDISRSIKYFLWVVLHGAYRVGAFWDSIPNHQWKGRCRGCDTPETMEHILTECGEPGQKEVWNLATEMWNKKTGQNMKPTFGQILAGGATKFKDPGEKRLYKILITESAHLIWKLRNERVIGGDGPAPLAKIVNRWLKTINNRLAIDCAMTNTKKYGRKALKSSLVKKTWKKTLRNERTLVKDWPSTVGVLVGVG
jgi:ribonuclease HI